MGSTAPATATATAPALARAIATAPAKLLFARLGAAQAMARCADAMGRLPDLNDVSDAFYLEALGKCVGALQLAEHDAEGTGTKGQVADALAVRPSSCLLYRVSLAMSLAYHRHHRVSSPCLFHFQCIFKLRDVFFCTQDCRCWQWQNATRLQGTWLAGAFIHAYIIKQFQCLSCIPLLSMQERTNQVQSQNPPKMSKNRGG